MQSLNLRAALLRCLEHAKKTGLLGRDAVVRRTMLDECKGERLDEILAAFSSAVLKKMVAENARNQSFQALAQTIALQQRGYLADRSELHALILAHKFSLRKLLMDKTAARAKYEGFSRLLDMKDRAIARRKSEINILRKQESAAISNDDKLALWRALRINWSGSERWMETLLYGDTGAKRDAVLATPFDRVWRRVQAGRVSELENPSVGLLGQLEARVEAQRERLSRWGKLREKLNINSKAAGFEHQKRAEPHHQQQRGIDLGLLSHEKIRPGKVSPGKVSPKKRTGEAEAKVPAGEYARILNSLKLELHEKPTAQGPNLLSFVMSQKHEVGRPRPAEDVGEESISELGEVEEEEEEEEEEEQPSPPRVLARDLERSLKISSGQTEPEQPKCASRTFGSSRENRQIIPPQRLAPSKGDDCQPHRPLRKTAKTSKPIFGRRPVLVPDQLARTPSISPERPSSNKPRRTRESPPPTKLKVLSEPVSECRNSQDKEPPSPTQVMADKILASVSNTSPSPIKRPARHTLSLEERTRLSMARGPCGVDFDEDIRLTISPTKHAPTLENAAAQENDLVARTRKSMAGFEAARQKAQVERQRSQRKSKRLQRSPTRRETVSRFLDETEEHHVDDDDEDEDENEDEGLEPRERDVVAAQDRAAEVAAAAAAAAAAARDKGNDNSMLAEELMEKEQVDYEAVFMSRPKIKTSPLPSPIRAARQYEDGGRAS